MEKLIIDNKEGSELYQASTKYSGIDKLEIVTVKAGTILCSQQLLHNTGAYFGNNLDTSNLNARLRSEEVQVGPFKNPETGKITYKSKLGVYFAINDIEMAAGDTLANPAYGNGGGKQYVSFEVQNEIKKYNLWENKDPKVNAKVKLIPVMLNEDIEKQLYERGILKKDSEEKLIIPKYLKDGIKTLKNIKTQTENKIEDGEVLLEKTELSEQAYNWRMAERDYQSSLLQKICTIYNLEQEIKNGNNTDIKDLKKQIKILNDKIETDKINLGKRKKELIKNKDVYCEIFQTEEERKKFESENYLEEKYKKSLELLNYIEKRYNKSEEFTMNSEFDIKIKDLYEKTVKEPQKEVLDRFFGGYRERNFIPNCEQKKDAVLGALVLKEKMEYLQKSLNEETSEKLKEQNRALESVQQIYEKEIKERKENYKNISDSMINSLKERNDNYTYSEKRDMADSIYNNTNEFHFDLNGEENGARELNQAVNFILDKQELLTVMVLKQQIEELNISDEKYNAELDKAIEKLSKKIYGNENLSLLTEEQKFMNNSKNLIFKFENHKYNEIINAFKDNKINLPDAKFKDLKNQSLEIAEISLKNPYNEESLKLGNSFKNKVLPYINNMMNKEAVKNFREAEKQDINFIDKITLENFCDENLMYLQNKISRVKNLPKELYKKLKPFGKGAAKELLKTSEKILKCSKELKEIEEKQCHYREIIKKGREISERIESLKQAEKYMKIIEKYQPVINKYKSKKIFKNMFEKIHEKEIKEYEKASACFSYAGFKTAEDLSNAKKLLNKDITVNRFPEKYIESLKESKELEINRKIKNEEFEKIIRNPAQEVRLEKYKTIYKNRIEDIEADFDR